MSSRVTQAQIAVEAGVSVPTVSAVLNKRTEGIYFSVETRDRVLATAERLGYRVNAAARQLRLGRSQVVGLAVDDLSLPFLAAVVQAAVAELRRADYDCLLIHLADGDKCLSAVERCRRLQQAGRIDALLLAGSTQPLADTDIAALSQGGLSAVLVERRLPTDNIPSVAVDNVLGGRLAAGHLLEIGRRRPALIGGPADNAMSRDRLDGACFAYCEAAAVVPKMRQAEGDWSLESGHAAMTRLLKQSPDLDAVFAANDLMAIGALAALRVVGRLVPDQVAVVGYDDAPLAMYVQPALTSVRQPAAAMGRNAARLVLGGFGHAVGAQEPLIPELIVRHSTRSLS